MKVLDLVLRRSDANPAGLLALNLATVSIELLLTFGLLWTFAQTSGQSIGALRFLGFLVLVPIIFLGRSFVQAHVTRLFAAAAADTRRVLLDQSLRIEAQAWERYRTIQLRDTLASVPTRLNMTGGSLSLLFYLAVITPMTVLCITWFYWPIGLLCMAAYLVLAVFSGHISGQMAEHEVAAQKEEAQLAQGLHDLAHGRKELLLDPDKADRLFADTVMDSIRRRATARAPGRRLQVLNTLVYEGADAVILSLAILAEAVIPHARGSLEPMVAMMAVYLLPFGMFSTLPLLSAGEAAATEFDDLKRRLESLADTTPPGDAELRPAAIRDGFASLALRDVTYSYADSRNRFRAGPLNIAIQRGTVTFVTGANGGGKSTLVKLLMGIYPPRSGHAELNGAKADLRSHRQLFSYIAADHVLFDRLFGYRSVPPERVRARLAEFGLDQTIHYTNGRFNRLDLSAGQRKRVGLAVALLEEKPVLVLDEWAAEQDPEMRQRFYRQILPDLRARGITVIAVTHDERYFDACDQLVVVRDGMISWSGAPQSRAAEPVA